MKIIILCLLLILSRSEIKAVEPPQSSFIPRPFSVQSSYMSRAGYLRHKEFLSTGVWDKALYDYTPMQIEIGDFGGDPSIGELTAYFTFQRALREYPNKVIFVIHWTCQAPEPGEGPMRDWHFDIRANRFRDAWPNGDLRPSKTIKLIERNAK